MDCGARRSDDTTARTTRDIIISAHSAAAIVKGASVRPSAWNQSKNSFKTGAVWGAAMSQ
jgi:hypothetical protein